MSVDTSLFCHEIYKLAQQYGWLIMGTQSWLILTNGVTLLFAVLADTGASLSKEQALWLSQLLHTEKVECHVWRPDDLVHIPQLLRRPKR